MAVESFDLSTRARLDHPRQLCPVRVLQAQHQLITCRYRSWAGNALGGLLGAVLEFREETTPSDPY